MESLVADGRLAEAGQQLPHVGERVGLRVARGVGVARALQTYFTPPPVVSVALPAPAIHDPTRPTAVIIAGNYGTESSDLLGPYGCTVQPAA